MGERIPRPAAEDGIGLALALSVLAFVSFMGLYMALGAVTEIRLSDNFEAQIKARAAALGGLNHARELMRGLSFDGLLQGPDGTFNAAASYLAQARSFGFRNPLSWRAAGSLDIENPLPSFSSVADDGVISNGRPGFSSAVTLIPQGGMPWVVQNPHGPGYVWLSRYFVKVTDNNGEPSEASADPANNPFIDGDGMIVVRSMGIARTLAEPAGNSVRRNSIAVYEARLQRRKTFELNAPLVVVGSGVEPASTLVFQGEAFHIEGGPQNAGIVTADTDTADGRITAGEILGALAPPQMERVQGSGLLPSVRDQTGALAAHQDRRLLLDRDSLLRFARRLAPAFADRVFVGNQTWTSAPPAGLGRYDVSLPANAPGQDPLVTWVGGDLEVGDGVEGGGVLVVTGGLTILGRFHFTGLVLVIGTGKLDASVCQGTVTGGVLLARVLGNPGQSSWEAPRLSIGGSCGLDFHPEAVRMGVSLIPPAQVGFREITSTIDP